MNIRFLAMLLLLSPPRKVCFGENHTIAAENWGHGLKILAAARAAGIDTQGNKNHDKLTLTVTKEDLPLLQTAAEEAGTILFVDRPAPSKKDSGTYSICGEGGIV